jgi:hypothetical protein
VFPARPESFGFGVLKERTMVKKGYILECNCPVCQGVKYFSQFDYTTLSALRTEEESQNETPLPPTRWPEGAEL